MSAPVLAVRDITKTFGGIHAVNGVSFEVRAGEILGLIGPNGSGKSTLFNCILGQLRPDSGEVQINGRAVSGRRACDLNKLGVGRTFQQLSVFPQMSVIDNIILAGQEHTGTLLSRLIGKPDAGLTAQADQLIGFFRLSHLRDEMAGSLSYGQQKLLDAAMAFMAGPALVLLDEPAGGVNLTMLAGFKERLMTYNREHGTTFVVIEHNMEFVMSLCTRIIVLAEGRIIAQGSPQEVRSNQTVIDAYLWEDDVLEVKDVHGGYGKITILNGVSFEIPRASITTVIGPNGAGKSTVFKAIFGLLNIHSGEIRLGGKAVTRFSPRQMIGEGVSYVPQGRNVIPQLSVRHNLELGGVTATDQAKVKRRIDEVMDQFPMLRERQGQKAISLSGGQQKQLEIARSLILDPRLILIDEPSIGLSPNLVQEVFRTLQQLRDNGATVLMVEQNAKAALAMSDYGLVLELGQTRLHDRAKALLADPRVGRLFLGGAIEDEPAAAS